ncbi:MAG: cell division protein ZapB [Treponema sp.]|jgi:FtsZ-binding cell division protein ZapB|nr:cell division protein ZapB [Treponema sp.]
MATLENVKLLETKVAKAVEVVKQLAAANASLIEENNQLKKKVEAFQNQINELEFSILAYKEDQQNIENGILSALDRLNQVEDSLEANGADSARRVDSVPPDAQHEQPVQNPPNNGDIFHEQGYQGNNVYYPS